MTLRNKTLACAALALALASVASMQSAQARWIFHDEAVGEKITAPPGATRAQTCAGRLEATAGYGAFIGAGDDPAAFVIPADATNAVSYEVWKAPAGFDNFDGATQDAGQVYFDDADGRHQATRVGRVTTPPRTVLATPEPTAVDHNVIGGVFVFATAPISARLTGVEPGDALALTPAGSANGIFDDVTAINCNLPVLAARVDVVPGSRSNTVHPTNVEEQVPVRVFGSRRLRVRAITTVHLGEAAATSAQRPRDVNGDGRPDRLYTFRQGDTDVLCTDSAVKVTGKTSDRVRFQARSPITTAGCGD
jgi:hypothetical protein